MENIDRRPKLVIWLTKTPPLTSEQFRTKYLERFDSELLETHESEINLSFPLI